MKHLSRLIAPLFLVLSFNAFAVDSDGDGLDDSVETNTGTFVSASDTGTNPNVFDSDNDGFSDGAEVAFGTDPNAITQSPFEQKLTASDAAGGDYFGYSVSISGDTAVMGARSDDDNGLYSGSAYVYVRSNGVWSEQQKLTASDGAANDYFGDSVSISGDTAVIGAHSDDDNGSSSGSAYVYVRSNGVWTEQQKLTASDGAADDQFGFTVSISGNTAVMGAVGDDDNGSSSGSAYVYVRSNGVWSEQQKLTASDGAGEDYFGTSVSISGDTAVMGARWDDDNGLYSGSAYVYVRSNGVWSEQQKLTASDGAGGDQFGLSVSISGDTVVVGAYGDDDNGFNSGSAYVYVRSNGVWSEQQKLTASDGASGDYFSYNVSISGDTAVIGARFDDDNGNGSDSGSAYVYVRSNGVWSEQQKLTASDAAGVDFFGTSVSISGDTAVIGAYQDDDNGDASGSAYVYVLAPPFQDTPAVITGDLNAEIEQAGVVSGTVIATDPDGLTDGSYFTLKTDATYGQALINPESGFWIYLADLNYYGPDPFTITVTDDLNYTTDQEISINVQCFDDDEDTVCNVEDNCPAISNPLQEDLDFDDEGDACDADIDGDTYANGIDAFPNDPSEWFDTDGDNTGDNTDNCITKINVDQSDIDGDTLGDVCDDDMDNDGVPNIVELRFGGNQTDANDAATSLTNFALYAENAEADDDFDGFSNTVELAANTNPNDASDAPQAELNILEALSITKTVPAIGGIGLFVMFSSLIGLGFLKRKKN